MIESRLPIADSSTTRDVGLMLKMMFLLLLPLPLVLLKRLTLTRDRLADISSKVLKRLLSRVSHSISGRTTNLKGHAALTTSRRTKRREY